MSNPSNDDDKKIIVFKCPMGEKKELIDKILIHLDMATAPVDLSKSYLNKYNGSLVIYFMSNLDRDYAIAQLPKKDHYEGTVISKFERPPIKNEQSHLYSLPSGSNPPTKNTENKLQEQLQNMEIGSSAATITPKKGTVNKKQNGAQAVPSSTSIQTHMFFTNQVLVRNAVQKQHSCNCTAGCVIQRCSCKKNDEPCDSRCHKTKKSTTPCQNI
uniref:Uncharacterized protein n=1 Tax=Panagrolaimus sp. ES5 TaxID=591445 RepID=A0AC34F8C1_9BILA